ncbi:SocA family protein [Patescibacteria group bacterium]|nr:SocA family protein [Patescibacteria group bacterium]
MKILIEFDHQKATQAINFFAKKEGGKIDKLKLLKLIWLADRYHLRKYGRPIINDTYWAMSYGPVASAVKDIVAEKPDFLSLEEAKYLDKYIKCNQKNNEIKSIAEIDSDVFSKTDLESLEQIYKEYGKFKNSSLVKISHEFPEWKKFKDELESKAITRKQMNYNDFFDNPDKDASVKNIFDENKKKINYAKSIFKENYRIADSWA